MRIAAAYRLNPATQIFAVLAGLIAGIGFFGYLGGSSRLISGGTNLAATSPITAICLLGLAVALVASARGMTGLLQATSLSVGMVTIAMLLNRLVTRADTISPLVAHAIFHKPPAFTGRMSLATALATLLIAISLVSTRRWRTAADVCAATATTISITAIFGYLLSVDDLYAIPMFSTMAVNTALALLLLSTGALSLRLTSHYGDGMDIDHAKRRKIVELCGIGLVPALTSWLLLSTVSYNLLSNISIGTLVLFSGSLPLSLLLYRDSQKLDSETREVLRRWQ